MGAQGNIKSVIYNSDIIKTSYVTGVWAQTPSLLNHHALRFIHIQEKKKKAISLWTLEADKDVAERGAQGPNPNVFATSDYTMWGWRFYLYGLYVWFVCGLSVLKRRRRREETRLEHLVWESERAEDNLTRGASGGGNSRQSVNCDGVVYLKKSM